MEHAWLGKEKPTVNPKVNHKENRKVRPNIIPEESLIDNPK